MIEISRDLPSIPQEAIGMRNLIEGHTHFEGSLFPSQLFAIAEKLQIDITHETKEEIQRQFNEAAKNPHDSKSLIKFISRFSTRWMRFFHARIILTSNTPEEAIYRQKQLDRAFIWTDLEQKYRVQHLQTVVELFSPWNMTGFGGNLSFEYLQGLEAGSLINQERDTYRELLTKYASKNKRGEYFRSTLWWQQYAQNFSEVVKDFEKMVISEGGKFNVVKIISLRRNDVERLFLQSDPEHDSTANIVSHALHRLIVNRVIDGVDISGVESEQQFSIEMMTQFLEGLKERNIYMTAHVGELNYTKNRSLGRKNHAVAQKLGSFRMIAHGNRLLDSRNTDLLNQAGQQQQVLLVNLLSNYGSGVSGRPTLHPGIKKFPQLVDSGMLSLFTTDDHIATYKDGQHQGMYLAAEQQLAVEAILKTHPYLFSAKSIEEFLDVRAYQAQELMIREIEEHRALSQITFDSRTETKETESVGKQGMTHQRASV